MSTQPPPLIVSGPEPEPLMVVDDRPRLWLVGVIVFVVVIVQVSALTYMRLADGTPDLVAGTIVAVGLLRGRLVGAVAGFAAGLLMELTSPVDTLGAFALLYLVVGWFCGRYCEREEANALLPPMVLAAGAVGFVQLGYASLQIMLGRSLLAGDFASQVMLPTLVLSVLLFPLILLVARRLLGAPRAYDVQVAW